MTISDIYVSDKFITEISGKCGRIKAETDVTIISTDGEDFVVIQDENGVRDLIDYAYLIPY